MYNYAYIYIILYIIVGYKYIIVAIILGCLFPAISCAYTVRVPVVTYAYVLTHVIHIALWDAFLSHKKLYYLHFPVIMQNTHADS